MFLTKRKEDFEPTKPFPRHLQNKLCHSMRSARSVAAGNLETVEHQAQEA